MLVMGRQVRRVRVLSRPWWLAGGARVNKKDAQFGNGRNSRSSGRRRLREIYRQGKTAPAGRYERLRRHKGPGLGRSLQSFELRLITKLADHKISLFR